MTTTEAHEKVLVWDRYTGVAVLTMQHIYIYVDFTLFNYLSANTFVCGLNILPLHVSWSKVKSLCIHDVFHISYAGIYHLSPAPGLYLCKGAINTSQSNVLLVFKINYVSK
jgi:hypothetical protein